MSQGLTVRISLEAAETLRRIARRNGRPMTVELEGLITGVYPKRGYGRPKKVVDRKKQK